MSVWFALITLLFIVVSIAMVLIILVQRPQGGGLAGAFGGAGGGGTDTAFGGRTGDVLTVATTAAFALYLVLAIALNLMDNTRSAAIAAPPADTVAGDVVDIQEPTGDAAFDAPVQPSTVPAGTGAAPLDPALTTTNRPPSATEGSGTGSAGSDAGDDGSVSGDGGNDGARPALGQQLGAALPET